MEFIIAKNVRTSPAVYKMSIDNKWFYVGSSINPHKRVLRWKCALKNHKHLKNINIKQVLEPESKIMFVVIQLVENVDDLRRLETKWIQKYWNHPGSLNRCPAGDSNKGVRPYFGQIIKKKPRKNAPTTKKPIAQFNKDGELIATFPSILAASNALNTRERSIRHFIQGKKGPFRGTSFKMINKDGSYIDPPKFIRKKTVRPSGISGPRLMGRQNGKAKAVVAYSIGGQLIQKFEAISEAAIALRIHKNSISAVLCGKRKSSGGHIFKYAD